MNIAQLKLELKNKLENVYLIRGNEQFSIDEAQALILKSCKLSIGEMDCVVFNDENFNPRDCLNALEQFPLFSEKRVVIVKDACHLSDSDKKLLIKYVESPNTFSVLVFVDESENDVFRCFETYATVVDCVKYSVGVLAEFIKSDVASFGKTITREAVNLLIEFCSSNMLQIKNELVKIKFSPYREITEESIVMLTANNLEYEVYELTNALAQKNADKTMRLISDMLKNNQNILGLISASFRRMFFALISNLTTVELAKIFKVKEYAITKAKEQAQKFGARKLKKINELLLETEYMIKSGKMQQDNAIYYLALNILN